MRSEDGLLEDETTFKRVIVNLAKIKEKWYTKHELTELEELFAIFIFQSKKELMDFVRGNEYLEEVGKEMIKFIDNPDVIGLYDKEEVEKQMHEFDLNEAKEEGTIQGTKEGIEQGIEQEKISTAKKMLDNHMELNIISKITGLTKKRN